MRTLAFEMHNIRAKTIYSIGINIAELNHWWINVGLSSYSYEDHFSVIFTIPFIQLFIAYYKDENP